MKCLAAAWHRTSEGLANGTMMFTVWCGGCYPPPFPVPARHLELGLILVPSLPSWVGFAPHFTLTWKGGVIMSACSAVGKAEWANAERCLVCKCSLPLPWSSSPLDTGWSFGLSTEILRQRQGGCERQRAGEGGLKSRLLTCPKFPAPPIPSS